MMMGYFISALFTLSIVSTISLGEEGHHLLEYLIDLRCSFSFFTLLVLIYSSISLVFQNFPSSTYQLSLCDKASNGSYISSRMSFISKDAQHIKHYYPLSYLVTQANPPAPSSSYPPVAVLYVSNLLPLLAVLLFSSFTCKTHSSLLLFKGLYSCQEI